MRSCHTRIPDNSALRSPHCRLHGLRMLDPRIFSCFPFASADSTNIGRNIGIDQAWHGPYAPPTKESRTQLMRSRVEAINAPATYDYMPAQPLLQAAEGGQG